MHACLKFVNPNVLCNISFNQYEHCTSNSLSLSLSLSLILHTSCVNIEFFPYRVC